MKENRQNAEEYKKVYNKRTDTTYSIREREKPHCVEKRIKFTTPMHELILLILMICWGLVWILYTEYTIIFYFILVFYALILVGRKSYDD
jgi:uncharacterized membrane protein